MARPVTKIRIETDLIADAAGALLRVRTALGKRHGEQFRELKRRIESLGTGEPQPGLTSLPDSEAISFVATPPQEWIDVLAQAKRLGVI